MPEMICCGCFLFVQFTNQKTGSRLLTPKSYKVKKDGTQKESLLFIYRPWLLNKSLLSYLSEGCAFSLVQLSLNLTFQLFSIAKIFCTCYIFCMVLV